MAHGPAPGNLRRNIESRPRPHRFHAPGTLEICERIIGFVTTVMSDGTTRHLHRSSPMRAVDCQRALAVPTAWKRQVLCSDFRCLLPIFTNSQPIKPPIRDMRSHLATEGLKEVGGSITRSQD